MIVDRFNPALNILKLYPLRCPGIVNNFDATASQPITTARVT